MIRVLDASPNAVIAVDAEGVIVYANPKVPETFGYAPAELIGSRIETLLPESVRERHVGHRTRFFRQLDARPMGIGMDLAGRRKDGTEFPAEISLSPVLTENGQRVYATVIDITARKALENELLQAQKMESIGRLAGGIAHDFNNMLSAISGYANLLLSDLDDPGTPLDRDGIRTSVHEIESAARRAAALTSRLLAFSRQQVLAPRVLDVRETIRSIEPLVRRLVGEQIQLVINLDPKTGRIRADPGQLEQITVNLAINARDAMPHGGTITIETSNSLMTEAYAAEHYAVEPGDYVVISIADSGVGMDRATREHIFEPFFTTKEQGKGTGLGLATMYGVVRQSGGHVWLYSEPGLGTTFKIYFPRVDAPVDLAESAPAVGTSRGTGTVLLVEDEESVRQLITLVLERAGYTVLVTRDANEALGMLDRVPDVVALISDVVMPGMSGPELARKTLERRPGLGIVLLSGYMPDALEIDDLLAGGAKFVGKPFTPRELTTQVNDAITAVERIRRGPAAG
jgi:two-component system cell cycle sensor histidine kinase/response regulator CckA